MEREFKIGSTVTLFDHIFGAKHKSYSYRSGYIALSSVSQDSYSGLLPQSFTFTIT